MLPFDASGATFALELGPRPSKLAHGGNGYPKKLIMVVQAGYAHRSKGLSE